MATQTVTYELELEIRDNQSPLALVQTIEFAIASALNQKGIPFYSVYVTFEGKQ